MARHFTSSRCRRSLVVLLLVSAGLSASAQDRRSWKNPGSSPTGASNFRSKSGNANTRWTLKDWLEQKDRNRMMDLWLGMYAPSSYEILLSGAQLDYQNEIDVPSTVIRNYKSWKGSVHFFALVLGIGAQYENNWNEGFNDLQGTINLRIAGNSNGSTHLNIFGGLRNRTANDGSYDLRGQPLAGAELDLYVQRNWGLHGNYRSFFAKDETSIGSVVGENSEAGIFIEVMEARLFGNWYSETFNSTSTAGLVTHRTRTGWIYGLRIMF